MADNTSTLHYDAHTCAKLAFVWFTYSLDHPILLRSVKAVRLIFPTARLIIADDTSEGKALPKRVIDALSRMGCAFIPTVTPRMGNLRGWRCAKMIADTYKWIIDSEDVDMVVKVDSDALMLNPTWIVELLRDDKKRYGGMRSKCHRSVCGPTYALKRDAVAHLYESYQNDMESPYHTEEDFEMASRLCRAYKNDKSVIMQVPYSFRGIHPEFIDAAAGMFIWQQNSHKWYKQIAENWQEVVLGYPVRQFTGKTKEDRIKHTATNNIVKAAVMKRLFAMARMYHKKKAES